MTNHPDRCRELTEQVRAELLASDIEILWNGMPVWRVGRDFIPDPELFERVSPEAAKWAAKPAKFVRDAEDYWFHVYRPQAGDVTVDIGAGRGEDVFAFSRAVGPAGSVWAMEPHPVSYAALELLCRMNGLSNTRCMQFACASTPGNLQIETLPVWESNYIREGPGSPTSHAVRAIRFDDFCVEHAIDRIDFLKMNIEGAEREALPGCREALPGCREALPGCREALRRARFVCVAAHDFRADRGEGEGFRTLAFVKDTLAGAGFSTVTRDDPRYYVPYHVHGFRSELG